MGKSIQIRFTNESGVFLPGSLIEGHVAIELLKPMRLNGISLKFSGKAYVHFVENLYHERGASERYFKHETVLFRIEPDSDTQELAEGNHTFPFACKLPESLPSSFVYREGFVRYVVTCTIDRPWNNKKIDRPFTVVSVLDLNSDMEYSVPNAVKKEKRLRYLCCKSGTITAELRIDRSGWVPGEAIKLYADIKNATRRTIKMSKVSLIMNILFFAGRARKVMAKEIACVTRPSIEGSGEDKWTGEELVIPPLPPSFLPDCSIIDIRYELQMTVEPEKPASPLVLSLPVVIGTIPLVSAIQQAPPSAAQSDTQADPPALTTIISNLPSLRYISGHAYNGRSYPLYPFYNFGHDPPPMSGGEEIDCETACLVATWALIICCCILKVLNTFT